MKSIRISEEVERHINALKGLNLVETGTNLTQTEALELLLNHPEDERVRRAKEIAKRME